VSTFYLGAHQPHWLQLAGFPLFVSHRQLARRRGPFRPAACRWALDSGGFTELSLHGRWVTPAGAYADAADRCSRQLGRLDFAAPQDWMCEPAILARTGLTIREHQVVRPGKSGGCHVVSIRKSRDWAWQRAA
jgi:hypothetical protein